MDAFVRVFFHSSSRKYNRVECWGPLKDAAKVLYTILILELVYKLATRMWECIISKVLRLKTFNICEFGYIQGRVGDQMQGLFGGNMESSTPPSNNGLPKSVFQILATFLL